ncbi:nuclear transport factor 2 family protein [Spongiimicrobium salis]|uniref:nuclear transport factor 2 family protein n=1 Tax=Spongiimicrobium salis TaxID=1667022 RepID=UPI00374D4F88
MIITEKETQEFNEYKAIAKALQPYIDSARSGDGKLIRSVFYDHTHIVGSMDGEFKNLDADTFGEVMDTLGESKDVQNHIAWIDISGPAAAAKIESTNWLGYRFTDFLVLYKKDGEWKISGKTFDSHSRN